MNYSCAISRYKPKWFGFILTFSVSVWTQAECHLVSIFVGVKAWTEDNWFFSVLCLLEFLVEFIYLPTKLEFIPRMPFCQIVQSMIYLQKDVTCSFIGIQKTPMWWWLWWVGVGVCTFIFMVCNLGFICIQLFYLHVNWFVTWILCEIQYCNVYKQCVSFV